MDLNEYKNKGLTGLTNVGNTCYLNSCVQILSNTYELQDIINIKLKNNKVNISPDGNMLNEWKNLMTLMWNKNCVITPSKFIQTIHRYSKLNGNTQFIPGRQNDAYEFLLYLFDILHKAIRRKIKIKISGTVKNDVDCLAVKCYKMLQTECSNDYSEINDLIQCVSIMSIYRNNEELSCKFEINSILHLNIPNIPNTKNIALTQCFDYYLKDEELKNDSSYFYEKENRKVDAVKKMSFWSFPKILIICLKRFDYSCNMNKINLNVNFPFDLDLSSYIKGYNSNLYKYELYGVINHIGNGHGGHYTSYIKNPNDFWYECNDQQVNKIRRSSVVSSNAYCLFYRKK